MLYVVKNLHFFFFIIWERFSCKLSETLLGFAASCQKKVNLDYFESIEKLCEIILTRTLFPHKNCNAIFKLTDDYKRQTAALDIIASFFNRVLDNYEKCRHDEIGLEYTLENNERSRFTFLDLLMKQEFHDSVKEEINTFIFAVISSWILTIPQLESIKVKQN